MPDFWDEQLEAEAAVIEAKRHAAEVASRIAEALRNGESTGDPIKDCVLLMHGIAPDILAKLKELDARLRAHVGEPVLIIEHREEFHACTGFGHEPEPFDYTRKEWVTLATVGPGGLDIDFSGWWPHLLLPIDQRASCITTRRPGGRFEIVVSDKTPESLISLRPLSSIGAMLDQPIDYKNAAGRIHNVGDKHLEIVVGTEAVNARFERDPDRTVLFGRGLPGELLEQLTAALAEATIASTS